MNQKNLQELKTGIEQLEIYLDEREKTPTIAEVIYSAPAPSQQNIESLTYQKGVKNMSNIKIQVNIPGASINKVPRKDGRWQGYYTIDGKKYYVYGKDYDTLAKKLQKFFNEKRKGKGITYADYLDKWLDLYIRPNLRRNTINGYVYCINLYLRDTVGKRYMSDITTDDLQECINNIPFPRQKELACNIISASFRQACGQYIKNNPAEKIIKYKAKSKKRMPLTLEQQNSVLTAVKDTELELLVNFYIWTGCRRAEALAVKWEEINFEVGTISIFSQKDERGEEVDTKTQGSVRTIPILPPLRPFLEKYKKAEGYLFPYKPDWVSRHLRDLFDGLGLKNIDVHCLRHTFSTRLNEYGIPDDVVAKWMGHTNVSTTKGYQTVLSDFEQANITKLKSIFDTKFDTKPPKKR